MIANLGLKTGFRHEKLCRTVCGERNGWYVRFCFTVLKHNRLSMQ